jgi:hypothetical protein
MQVLWRFVDLIDRSFGFHSRFHNSRSIDLHRFSVFKMEIFAFLRASVSVTRLIRRKQSIKSRFKMCSDLCPSFRILVSIWSSALVFSLLPIVFTSYFKDEFYSRSGVCLALHITNKKPAGWEYAVALFLAINLLAFVFIVACYSYMYQTIQRSSRRLTRIMSKEVRERQVGRQMAFIVMTNFCCWFPIIVMGFLALFGHPIPASVYSWTAVFILPVNSAVNPIIYTLAHFKPHIFRRNRRDSLIPRPFYPLKHTGSMQASKTQGLLNRSPRPPPGFLSLLEYLRENRELKMSDLLHICYSLSDQIRQVHSSGYALGRITFDTVFIGTQVSMFCLSFNHE